MKIAIDIRNVLAGRTGDETVFASLVRALAERDRDNEYHLLIDRRSDEELSAVERALNLRGKDNFRFSPIGSGGKFSWNGVDLPAYCRRQRPDIYHGQYITPLWGTGATKIITHIHDVSFCAVPEQIPRKDLFLLRALLPAALRCATTVIAVSEFTAREIARFYRLPAEKIKVVPNALSADFTPAGNIERKRMRERYGLEKPYILSLGTMQPRKNIPFLLRVFAALAERLPDLELVLAGGKGRNFDSSIEKTLTQNPELRRRTRLIGRVAEEDLPALYAEARVFVFPSLYEGFGLPLLEAARAQTPIVASDLAVFREVIGRGALFADPRDLANFARALYTAVVDSSKRKELIAEASARAAVFSWDASAEKLLEIYREAIDV